MTDSYDRRLNRLPSMATSTGQTSPLGLQVTGLHFEHYATPHQLGTHIRHPRLSWTFTNSPDGFQQRWYELEIYDRHPPAATAATNVIAALHSARVDSSQSVLVPWPLERDLQSRERLFARVRAGGCSGGADSEHDEGGANVVSAWSNSASIEAGLMDRSLWQAELVTAPWNYPADSPSPEELYRTQFTINNGVKMNTTKTIRSARLYITAQGVYEAEMNGTRVGDQFMAPGWTVYGSRLRYQCYDVLEHLSLDIKDQKSSSSSHVLGVRLAEGWYCGRLSWGGGSRNMFGERLALMAQVEIGYDDGTVEIVASTGGAGRPSEWWVTQGPIRKAEIYDGEKYDARLEVDDWSKPCHSQDNELPAVPSNGGQPWQKAVSCGPLPAQIELLADEAEPVRRVETVQPVQKITTPSGKTIIDFGQNLVGHVRILKVSGPAGTVVTLRHAEVLEHGELGTRPLRKADNRDEYTLRGEGEGEVEQWQPRFTFHGFRYVEVDGWPSSSEDIMTSIEAVICHTDMVSSGIFTCSDPLVSRLHDNVTWSMRGNFVSVPTDCPQRDERLGWTGDLAMFAPTATLLYKCSGMLQGWLRDVAAEQAEHGGIPPLVVPNVLKKDPMFSRVMPAAVWGDVAVLAPWALYQATGDVDILRNQYSSMAAWVSAIPRNKKSNNKHLWNNQLPQLGDWLDPTAPPDNPAGGKTNSILVADAFLINTLDVIAQAAALLEKPDVAQQYQSEAAAARSEFAHEYITPSGRVLSDSQTAYALAIVFDLFPGPSQRAHACARLIELVRRNAFKIGTGFAGTPYILEALTLAGAAASPDNNDNDENIGAQVAYSMLHHKTCPSWLYSVTMGATTIWERYDSMLPDGTVNPGEMTSFNHYALGAVARWLWERCAGLQRVEAGWRRARIAPVVGGEMTHARASHVSPYGEVVSEWRLLETVAREGSAEGAELRMDIVVPPNTSAEVVFPRGSGREPCEVGAGKHSFSVTISRHTWPIEAIRLF